MPAGGEIPKLKRLARRLVRPVLSPIDGRVDDINRRTDLGRSTTLERLDRIETLLAQAAGESQVELADVETRLQAQINSLSERLELLRMTLDTHSDSLQETVTYASAELRRLDESVREVSELVSDAAGPTLAE